MHTILEERGSNLSSGHRQRIAIERSNAIKLRILILDATTSALNYEDDNLFHNYLKRIATGRTVLMIAHCLSTVRNTDMTFVTGEGRDAACAWLVRTSGLGS